MELRRLTFFSGLLLIAITSCFGQYVEADWKERDTWMDPGGIMNRAGVTPGDHVADLGCHEGYFTMHLAGRVGEEGLVYGVDIVAARLKALEAHAKSHHLGNVRTIQGIPDDPGLPKGTLDVVFIIDAYHEMDAYKAILEHVRESLKPGGRIVILEKLKEFAAGFDRKEQANAHTLAPAFVKNELKEAGYIITAEHDDIGNWEGDTTKKMWLLVGTRPPAQ